MATSIVVTIAKIPDGEFNQFYYYFHANTTYYIFANFKEEMPIRF